MEEKKDAFELKRHWWIPAIFFVLIIALAVLLGTLIGEKSPNYVAPAPIELSTETARTEGSPNPEWCIMLNLSNGMHLPHLDMNIMRDAIIPNGQSGYNWDMPAGKYTVNDQAAVLEDGTYMVKKVVIDQFRPQNVHFKVKEMGYIPQIPIEVRLSNGDAAFVWNRDPAILEKYKE